MLTKLATSEFCGTISIAFTHVTKEKDKCIAEPVSGHNYMGKHV